MFLKEYIMKNGGYSNYSIFEADNFFEYEISTNDLLMAQFLGNEYNAYDVVVKYLAVENYYGLNNYGFSLYKKMQEKRINENWEHRFIELIKSVESKGFDNNSRLETDINYSIHDGAHRLALALFIKKESLMINIFNANKPRRYYGKNWFLDNGFTNEEIAIIEEKMEELIKEYNIPYYGIVWPTAKKIFSKIENEIKTNEYGIEFVDSYKLNISASEFKKFVSEIYKCDDILPQKLDMKYNHMLLSITDDNYISNYYPVNVIRLNIYNPEYRIKTFNGVPQSTKALRLKQKIRMENKNLITNYYYDIILHITDNIFQNKCTKKILEKHIRR